MTTLPPSQSDSPQDRPADPRDRPAFLAVLAHELRNPLAPIRNAIHVLRLRGTDPATLDWATGVLERQVAHLARMIDDLLDVSRLSRGKVRLQRERLDLTRLVRTAADDHRPALQHAGLTLELDLPPMPLWVDGDATRLDQVLDNLLDNACKFTPPGGRVSVHLGGGDGWARVDVHDTGIGIAPELLPRLFETLTQADSSLARSQGGLGLGLALIRGLVELHGGTAEARSDGLGQGAEFTLRIPLAQEGPEAGLAAAAGGQGRRLRILMVEDNRDGALTLRALLQLAGHEVALACTGPEGVELAHRFRPDVVLCDIGLPGMDGFAVGRALRRDPVTARSRLIVLSGYGQEEDRRKSREAGFDIHLTKPVDPLELQKMLAG